MRWLRGAMVGGVIAVAAAPAAAQPADPVEGRRLAAAWCSQCHVIGDGVASGRDVGPPFAALANDPQKSEAALRAFLHHPEPPMPPLELSTRDIDHLVAYIRSLARD